MCRIRGWPRTKVIKGKTHTSLRPRLTFQEGEGPVQHRNDKAKGTVMEQEGSVTNTQHRDVLHSASQGFAVRQAPVDCWIVYFKSWTISLVKCKNSALKENSQSRYVRLPGPSELSFSVD